MNAPKTLMLLAAMAILSCGRSTPTSPTASSSGCADVSGVYDVTYQAHCPSNGYPAQWTLQQTTCEVHSAVAPDLPIVSGTVKGNTVHLVLTNGFISCQYRLEGDGQFDGQTIRAQLSGQTSGPCCGDSQETVTVLAVRRTAH